MPLKSIQVLGNQVLLAEQHGIHIPEGMDWHDPEQIAQFRTEQPDLWRRYVEITAERAQLRHCMAYLLEEARQDPASFGVQDFQWRECQGVLLRDQAWSLRNGYGKLASKLPTGGGKTHAEGAYARVALEAVGRDRWNDIEILALTSRANLVNQLSRGAGVSHSAQANQEGMGDGLDLGDLTRWLSPILTSEQIRILVGAPAVRERRKNAVVTIGTYQGLTERRIHELHSQREVLLIICDEMHNLSDRVRRLILTHFPGAMLAGLSATPQGPQRSPFLAFEEVRRPNHQENGPWQQGLASRQELSDLINRRELKPLRLLSSRTGISFADVGSEGGELNDEDVARVLTRNIPLLQQFLERLFTTQHPMLTLAGSRQPCERTWVAFVNRVSIATALARYCTDHLGIPATVMSGEDDQDAFDEKCCGLRTGQYRIAFSCRKAGEGLDVREIDGVLSLAPHGIASEWLLEQEIGRGERLIPGRPNADCLVVEPHYEDDPGLATTARILRQPDFANGGLVVPGPLRDAEMTVTRLMRSGQSLMDALATLPADQRELLVEQWGLGNGEGGGGGGGVSGVDTRDNLELDVTFIHRDDVQRLIIFQNPVLLLQSAREVLAEHQICSRQELMAVGPTKFDEKTFRGFGGARAFFSAVVRRLEGNDCITLACLAELADTLGWPEEDRAQLLARAKSALAIHGVHSRADLIGMGPAAFEGTQFEGFGSGRTLFTNLMEKGQRIDLAALQTLSNALGWPEEDRAQLLARAKSALASHGITSRQTLASVSIKAFTENLFEGFGSGRMLFSRIVRPMSSGEFITTSCIEQLADALGWPEESPIERARAALGAHNVTSFKALVENMGRTKFVATQFGDFGKGRAFFTALVRPLSASEEIYLSHMHELAEVLGWTPENKEQVLNRARTALAQHGIVSRQTLLSFGRANFEKADFTGFKSPKTLFSESVRQLRAHDKLTLSRLEELAGALGWTD